MLRDTPIRRRLTLGVAAGACALAAIPAGAQAAEVTKTSLGEIVVRDAGNEVNELQVSFDPSANRITIDDTRSMRLSTQGCSRLTASSVSCSRATVRLDVGGGDDTVQAPRSIQTAVLGGDGNDVVKPSVDTAAPSVLDFTGGAGTDTVDYSRSVQTVRIEKDNFRNDGRENLDADNIRQDVESLIGGVGNDVLIGWAGEDILDGGFGNDTMSGVGGTNMLRARGVPDGADNLIGGTGFDYADYDTRTARVLLSVDGVANDGAPGEGDNLFGIEGILAGAGNDVLRAGGASGIVLGGAGADFLFGTDGSDYLDGGAGQDGLSGGAGNDSLIARDGELDELLCGTGADSTQRDAQEGRIDGCEDAGVGTLRTSATQLDAGEPGTLRVSWTHPRAWKSLQRVSVTLVDQNRLPVGTLTVEPRSGEVRASSDAMGLRSSNVRLQRSGKTVTASIPVKPQPALAGAAIDAHVEAVERGGRTQLAIGEDVLRVAR